MKNIFLPLLFLLSCGVYAETRCDVLLENERLILTGESAKEIYEHLLMEGAPEDVFTGGSNGRRAGASYGFSMGKIDFFRNVDVDFEANQRTETYKIHFDRAGSDDLWNFQAIVKDSISKNNDLFKMKDELGFIIEGHDASEIYWALVDAGAPEEVDSGGSGGAAYSLDVQGYSAFRYEYSDQPEEYKIDLTNASEDVFRSLKAMGISDDNKFISISLVYALSLVQRNEREAEKPQSFWEWLFGW